jgi:hypothetical protein
LIRTFWFAAVCLASLGGLLATRVTASMALTAEGVIDPATRGEGPARDGLKDRDESTKDTLTKADRLDIAYCPAAAMLIADVQAKSIVVAETTPDASATPASQHPVASHGHRPRVMLPRPRPKNATTNAITIGNAIRIAKTSRPVVPVLDVKTCAQPEGLSGILMSFSSQPRCG